MTRTITSIAAVFSLSLVAGCTADLKGSSDSGEAGGPSGDGDAASPGGPAEEEPSDWMPGDTGGDPTAVATLPLRMITSEQFERTVELIFGEHYGVLGDGPDITSILQAETVDESGFRNVGEVTEVSVLRYLDAADAVVAALSGGLNTLAGCDVGAATTHDCAEQMVRDLGRLLYRRALTEEEVADHTTFWDEETQDLQSSPQEATEQLLRSMLTSPHFLYRWELTPELPALDGDGAIRLTSYQIASRLAFFLWGSGPTADLLDRAEAGELATDEQVAVVASEMLADPRASGALESFHRQWLHLEKLNGLFKDPARFPQWSDSLSDSMRREIELFTRHVVMEDDGRVETLFGANYTFANEELAAVYGVPGVTGDELVRVDLPPTERSGLLTMAGILAAASEPSVENPFKRGKLLLEQVMCRKLEPPPNVPPIPPPDEANPVPVRESLEELTSPPTCDGCHQHLNPMGFGLGHYNAIGAYQTEDELGFPIDASGALVTGEAFSDGPELTQALATHIEVRGCLTKQWFRFATSREENSADDYSLEQSYAGFAESDFNIRTLLTDIATSRSFLYRAADEGELTQ